MSEQEKKMFLNGLIMFSNKPLEMDVLVIYACVLFRSCYNNKSYRIFFVQTNHYFVVILHSVSHVQYFFLFPRHSRFFTLKYVIWLTRIIQMSILCYLTNGSIKSWSRIFMHI